MHSPSTKRAKIMITTNDTIGNHFGPTIRAVMLMNEIVNTRCRGEWSYPTLGRAISKNRHVQLDVSPTVKMMLFISTGAATATADFASIAVQFQESHEDGSMFLDTGDYYCWAQLFRELHKELIDIRSFLLNHEEFTSNNTELSTSIAKYFQAKDYANWGYLVRQTISRRSIDFWSLASLIGDLRDVSNSHNVDIKTRSLMLYEMGHFDLIVRVGSRTQVGWANSDIVTWPQYPPNYLPSNPSQRHPNPWDFIMEESHVFICAHWSALEDMVDEGLPFDIDLSASDWTSSRVQEFLEVGWLTYDRMRLANQAALEYLFVIHYAMNNNGSELIQEARAQMERSHMSGDYPIRPLSVPLLHRFPRDALEGYPLERDFNFSRLAVPRDTVPRDNEGWGRARGHN